MLIEILKPDFRFSDDRGILTQLVHNSYKQFNVIMSNAGASRGNHYHKQNEEAFYIINGEVTLFVQKGKIQEKYSFHTGDMFKIPRDVLHSFEFETDTLLASMYSHGVEMPDGTKDIFK